MSTDIPGDYSGLDGIARMLGFDPDDPQFIADMKKYEEERANRPPYVPEFDYTTEGPGDERKILSHEELKALKPKASYARDADGGAITAREAADLWETWAAWQESQSQETRDLLGLIRYIDRQHCRGERCSVCCRYEDKGCWEGC